MHALDLASLGGVIKSPIFLATTKGALAYILFFILFFIDSFRGVLPFSVTGSSAILFCIASFPGKSVGGCMLNTLLALAGITLGTLNFFLLARLAAYPVAQGISFFVMAYIMGRVRAQNAQLLAFSLLCILMTWNGIYTPLLTPSTEFKSEYLISYVESFCWGAVIALFVNLLVFPHSAEMELRVALVESLEKTKTFACLIEKTYRFVITEDEKKIRDNLAHTIQSDLNQLEKNMRETFLEVNRSRWSLMEYRKMIQFTQSMNQSLVTAHSSMMQEGQISFSTFHENFLLASWKNMESFRQYFYVALTEIQKGLAVGSMLALLETNQCQWLEEEIGKNVTTKYSSERSQRTEEVPLFSPIENHDCEIHLRELSRLDPIADRHSGPINLPRVQQLEPIAEVNNSSIPLPRVHQFEPTHDIHQPLDTSQIHDITQTSSKPQEPLNLKSPAASSYPGFDSLSELINFSWQAFQDMQHRRIHEILLFGSFIHKDVDGVFITEKHPQSFVGSVQSLCETPTLESTSRSDLRRKNFANRTSQASLVIDEDQSSAAISNDEGTDNSTLGSSEEISNIELYRSLIRASAYSFAMGKFVDHLIEMRTLAKDWNHLDSTKPFRIHFHFLEFQKVAPSLKTTSVENTIEHEQDIDYSPVTSDQQALEILTCRQRKPGKEALIFKVIAIEKFFRDSNSIYAFKMTFGIIAIAMLFWADKTRTFALDYGLNSCILTVAVAITPTLGQTWLSFIAQLIGQGLGCIYAVLVVKLFSDISGFRYNPYGLVVAMSIFAILMSYILYSRPQLFVLPFLAMNSAGQLVYIEYINQHRKFDSPALKLWKNVVCLMIAVLVVTSVQMLLLRNPAKHTLRSSVAKLMKSNTSYNLLLNSYTKSIMNPDASMRPSSTSFSLVYDYLVKTEERLQQDILELMPLLKFAHAEPSFGKNSGAELDYLKILRSNQTILDRNREARVAIGSAPFSDLVLEQFVDLLKLHRLKSFNQIASMFHLCTASLKAKLPLPTREFGQLSTSEFITHMFHDTVALSAQLIQAPGGMAIFQEDELTRYWTYLLSINGVLIELDNIRDHCQNILGTLGGTDGLV